MGTYLYLARVWHKSGTSLARVWHKYGTSLARVWHEFGTCLSLLWHVSCLISSGTCLALLWHVSCFLFLIFNILISPFSHTTLFTSFFTISHFPFLITFLKPSAISISLVNPSAHISLVDNH